MKKDCTGEKNLLLVKSYQQKFGSVTYDGSKLRPHVVYNKWYNSEFKSKCSKCGSNVTISQSIYDVYYIKTVIKLNKELNFKNYYMLE